MSNNAEIKEKEYSNAFQNIPTKKIASTGIFIAVGLVLSFINVFAYFYLFGTKINPYAHIINAMTGVLIGLVFSCMTALGIAILRFAFSIGTIHAFHGGISGAVVVGLVAHLIKKKNPKYVNLAALTEPLGTVFIGGTIAHLIASIGPGSSGLLVYWSLFAMSCIPGCIIGFVILGILQAIGITWEDFN